MTRSIFTILFTVAAVVLAAFAYQQTSSLNAEMQTRSTAAAAWDLAEATLKSARDQFGQLQGAKEATEKALTDAKKRQ